MSEETAFKMLVGIDWGMKYKNALDLFSKNDCLKVVQIEEKSYIQVMGKCDDNEFKAWLIFGGLFNRLKQINIDMLLRDSQKKGSDTTQMLVDDFLQTYYIMVEKLGKADSEKGMSLEKFKDMDYLGNTKLEDLPYFEWRKGRTLIKHRFIEKEGYAISTTLEPIK